MGLRLGKMPRPHVGHENCADRINECYGHDVHWVPPRDDKCSCEERTVWEYSYRGGGRPEYRYRQCWVAYWYKVYGYGEIRCTNWMPGDTYCKEDVCFAPSSVLAFAGESTDSAEKSAGASTDKCVFDASKGSSGFFSLTDLHQGKLETWDQAHDTFLTYCHATERFSTGVCAGVGEEIFGVRTGAAVPFTTSTSDGAAVCRQLVGVVQYLHAVEAMGSEGKSPSLRGAHDRQAIFTDLLLSEESRAALAEVKRLNEQVLEKLDHQSQLESIVGPAFITSLCGNITVAILLVGAVFAAFRHRVTAVAKK